LVYQSKWTLEQKIQVVMESLNTSITTAELCRKHNVTPNTFYDWKEKFVQGGKAALAGALKTNPNKELEEEVDRLKRIIGELTIANDSLKKAVVEGRRR
jgi:transposase-like protein